MDDLQDISHRIIIFIDGADELQSLYELSNIHSAKKEQLPSVVRSIYDLMDCHSNILTGHKTIIAARPEACQIIDTVFKEKIDIKMVEVCGFNAKHVNSYIDNYFKKKSDTAQLVKDKINESENLATMASIPVYTWVICAIFNEDINIEYIPTTTHLCSYACLVFVRNHLRKVLQNSIHRNCSLLEIINNEDILQIILYLAMLSKCTLKHKKVVFSEKDI